MLAKYVQVQHLRPPITVRAATFRRKLYRSACKRAFAAISVLFCVFYHCDYLPFIGIFFGRYLPCSFELNQDYTNRVLVLLFFLCDVGGFA
jgi:uncharacterized membrane protein YfhO